MSLWSLGFPGPLALHGLLCIPICLPGLLCLLCLVLVPLLCLPVRRWSPGLTCGAICMPAWSPGLTCGAICMPAWSPMALHVFLVSVCPCLVCLSVPGHLNLILVLLYSLLCIGFVGASLSEPHTSESFVGSSFYANIRQKTNLIPYKFLCDTKILCGIRNLLYMVVGSSVSRKPCDKVFLNGHIWSLDRQSHGEHVTKFS